MTITYDLLERPVSFHEGENHVLVIENPEELRRVLRELHTGTQGGDCSFVLGVDHNPADFSRSVEIIIDPFSLSFDSRQIESNLLREALALSDAYSEEVHQILSQINVLAARIETNMESNVTFTPLETQEKLFKLLQFHVDSDSLSFTERILEYLRIPQNVFGRQLFVIYGLRELLSTEELELFYRQIHYEKYHIWLIEPFLKEPVCKTEKVVIIDQDLCIIE